MDVILASSLVIFGQNTTSEQSESRVYCFRVAPNDRGVTLPSSPPPSSSPSHVLFLSRNHFCRDPGIYPGFGIRRMFTRKERVSRCRFCRRRSTMKDKSLDKAYILEYLHAPLLSFASPLHTPFQKFPSSVPCTSDPHSLDPTSLPTLPTIENLTSPRSRFAPQSLPVDTTLDNNHVHLRGCRCRLALCRRRASCTGICSNVSFHTLPPRALLITASSADIHPYSRPVSIPLYRPVQSAHMCTALAVPVRSTRT